MYKKRLLEKRLKKLLNNFPCVAILGARQVGKRTLIRHLMPTSDYVVFDPLTDIENARQDPDLFLSNHRTPLLMNEIQFAPEVISSLKRKIDSNRQNGSYLLTGSQQWQLMNHLSESLAGRVGLLELSGFSLSEYHGLTEHESPWLEQWLKEPDAFLSRVQVTHSFQRTLYEILWAGLLPEACQIDLDVIPDFHRSYQNTYIERDIRQMGEIGDWQNFGRFVQLLGALTGQEINFSLLGREIGINPVTAKRWATLLMGTYQWFTIPAFSNNPIKRVSHKPKGYLSDTGLASFAQRIPSPEALAGHPLLGALFETLIISDIQKISNQMAIKPNLYHWRSAGGAEVDLLLEWNQQYYPIEIKLTSHPTRKDCSGLQAFRAAHPHLSIKQGLVIAPCASLYPLTTTDYALPWNIISG